MCLSRMPCPLCNVYSSGWIISILGTHDHCHEMVCRAQWRLTLIQMFKVIQALLCNKIARIYPSRICRVRSVTSTVLN